MGVRDGWEGDGRDIGQVYLDCNVEKTSINTKLFNKNHPPTIFDNWIKFNSYVYIFGRGMRGGGENGTDFLS